MNFLNKLHPERNIDAFTRLDGTVAFYILVRAAALQTNAKDVLDFGAGRGAVFFTGDNNQGSLLRRHLCDLRFNGANVTACDVDATVLGHPCSNHQVRIEVDKTLPFADNSFDLIVSDWTFEHIDSAEFVASELSRILRPGGYLCARTPNAFGYLKIISQLIPNRLHTRVLKLVQPNRLSEDVFPTVYKMNSVSAITKLFPGFQIFCCRDFSDPGYYCGNSLIYRSMLFLHRLLPMTVAPFNYFFIRKEVAR